MADCDDIVGTYQRAVDGDPSAQSDLWREFRAHMLRLIRLKAADLRSQWAVEADDIYDLFMVELFNSERSVRFDNAYHLTCYIEKALRRRTAQAVRDSTNRCCVRLQEMAEPVTADFVEEIARRDKLHAAVSKLTRREQKICKLFGAGCGWREIGQRLGLTHDSARMVFRRALAQFYD